MALVAAERPRPLIRELEGLFGHGVDIMLAMLAEKRGLGEYTDKSSLLEVYVPNIVEGVDLRFARVVTIALRFDARVQTNPRGGFNHNVTELSSKLVALMVKRTGVRSSSVELLAPIAGTFERISLGDDFRDPAKLRERLDSQIGRAGYFFDYRYSYFGREKRLMQSTESTLLNGVAGHVRAIWE